MLRRLSIVLIAALSPVPAEPQMKAMAPTVDSALYSGMSWRNIGPFRGGRVSAVTGAVGQHGVFYMGLPLGGVWKTTSAGETWYPVFDSIQEASSVGAVEVAPSDPNVIYVGMGDLVTGGGINEGNGVYKSVDAGRTWQHMGLEATKQIPAILVDPHNPDVVLVAAQGDLHTKTDDRGLYRSTDGGKTWKKTLFIDNQTGIQDIAWAFDQPNVMLAMTVRHYTDPLAVRAFGGGAGGPGAPPAGPSGTAMYQSMDQGVTWKEVKATGLPTLAGRTTVAIAANSNARRMYLIGTFGLYRSDDGGANWKQMASNDRRIANGQGNYTSGVYVDPKNPDIVYTIATTCYRSTDGGATFTPLKGAPGGDDPQQMWIDPTDGQRLFLGYDQGATISLDAGQTWSSWYNQSTAQLYHISTDTSYPYWIYATQQDSGSIATRSRGDLGAITPLDWLPTPGYEFGSIVADPLNPKVIYAGGPAAGIVKITYPSGQWINVSPNIVTTDSLRKVGNQPLIFSPSNPRELFTGFQYLMSTVDGGMHWSKLGGDLTYPKGVTPPPPTATPTPRPAGSPGPAVPPPGSIESIAPSSVSSGTIWVGTNNGLIKVTTDHGRTWTDVTIPDLPNPTRADISAIDASHHDAATAYVAIDTHAVADYRPSLYRTHDYGKTWTKIVNGLATSQPSGSFTRVIRADTKKKGLLFAGSESSIYVSFDDGDNWQSLMLNLPNTSYRDLTIHENDLIAGTYGRGMWILDDISPLRQLTKTIAAEAAHLFKPGDAIRVRRNVNGDTPFPPEVPQAKNPPVGALIDYSLSTRPSTEITLDILDAAGTIVRHLSSAPIAPFNEPPPTVNDFWLEKPAPMPMTPGMHRIHWDIRHESPKAFTHSYEINANPDETPASPEGALALPGTYTLRLTVDGKSQTQTLVVRNDPRSPATLADLKAQHDLQMKIDALASTAWDGHSEVNALRASVAEITKGKPSDVVTAAVKALDEKLASVGGSSTPRRGGGGGGFPGAGAPPPPPNFAALQGTFIRQLGTLDPGDMAPNEPMLRVYGVACRDLKTAISTWKTVSGENLTAFNEVLVKNGLKPVPAGVSSLRSPVCPAAEAKPVK